MRARRDVLPRERDSAVPRALPRARHALFMPSPIRRSRFTIFFHAFSPAARDAERVYTRYAP